MLLTVGGPAGSGKSTLASLLSESLSLPLISTGSIFRQIASEHGMDVLSFNLYAEGHREVDEELDRRVVQEARRRGSCVVEGRLACHMLRRAGLRPFCVYLDAEEMVRAQRIAAREHADVADALSAMRRRGESERRRYMAIYGIDVEDTSHYDLVLDSSSRKPEELNRAVLEAIGEGYGIR